MLAKVNGKGDAFEAGAVRPLFRTRAAQLTKLPH